MRDITSVRAWLYISKNYHMISADNQKEFREYGLSTAQFDIIVNLGFRGAINQNSLASHLLVTKGNISTVLKGLEKKGLIARNTPKADRRLRLVRLTESGRSIYEEAVQKHEEKIASILASLTVDERKTLVRILKKLYSNLKVQAESE
jgi:DNA-binding MarR family transcriptional regulator